MTRRRMTLGGVSDYFFASYHIGGGTQVTPFCIDIDSGDNIFIVGDGSGNDAAIWRISNRGMLDLAFEDTSNLTFPAYAVDINSSDEVFLAAAKSTSAWILECDSDVSVSSTYSYDDSDIPIACVLKADGSASLYYAYRSSSGPHGGDDVYLAKISQSDYSVTWDAYIGSSGGNVPSNIVVDSSGDIAFSTTEAVTRRALCLVKVTAAGSISWQRTLEDASNNFAEFEGSAVAVDGSDNFYVAGVLQTTDTEIHLAKYNNSGTIQWQRRLSDSGVDLDTPNLVVDSSGNVYIYFRSASSGSNYRAIIAKYNSSGTNQWIREFYWSGSGVASFGPSPASRGRCIALDSNENIIVAGEMDGDAGNNPFGYGGSNWPFGVLKLPSDGSLTGTHGDYTYASGGATSGTATSTDAAGGLSSAAATVTVSSESVGLSALTRESDRTVIA